MSTTNGGDRLDKIVRLIERGELANQKAHQRIERNLGRLERDLSRWAALGVKEARSQRKRTSELDKKIGQLASAQILTEEKIDRLASAQILTEEKIDQLASAQILTEEALKKFIASVARGRNGH